MDCNIVSVLPFAGFDRELAYRLPRKLEGRVSVGSLVKAPIRNKQALAVVSRLDADDSYPKEKLKWIGQLVREDPVLSPDLIELARWMRTYYAAPLESILERMVPVPVRRGMGAKRERYLRPGREPAPNELAELARRAPRQAELYRAVTTAGSNGKSYPKSVLLNRLRVSDAVARALIEKGLLVEEFRRVERVAYQDDLSAAEAVDSIAPELNPEQAAAAADIGRSLANQKFAVHLLHGVTGSGKTEVYLRLIQQALQDGGGVIVLVPEVALTPQTVARLRGRLEKENGVKTVVWHSHLSEGERFDAWDAVASGEARVVVGARSAIFAPVRNLRLIVVDEEHEPAYKQEETPRYHGRDAAVYRAMLNRAVCVLGSATPSFESLHNVARGKYRSNRLLKRVDDRKLPLVHVVDMRLEMLSKKGSLPLSRMLADMMRQRFEDREQTILFINRRGYSSSMICPGCGHVCECDHCSVTLTYHRSDETLKCHLCGSERAAPRGCPSCDSPQIRWRGFGTQRVEEALQQVLPRARVERIDTDAMARKNRFREILADFRLGKIDVLVGTQMIAKGLDFPNVTLVGLVDADLSLHIPDFRASERTFQLLVQVAGRAGRGDQSGDVVVQTFTPHAAPIQYARRGEFDAFSEDELAIRREYAYPPYRHLIHHLFHGKNPEKVSFFASQWVSLVERELGKELEIRGPSPSPLEKVKDNYRFQAWYFCASVSRVIPRLQELRQTFSWPEGIVQVLDVDAVNVT